MNRLTKSKVRDTWQDYIIHSGSEGVKINVREIWAKLKTKANKWPKVYYFSVRLGDPWGKQGDLCHIREIPG